MSTAAHWQQVEQSHPEAFPDLWVYGFRLKDKLVNRLAEGLPLNWGPSRMQIVDRVVDTIGGTSDDGLDLSVRNVPYGNRYTLIIAFMEDDGRKRLANCAYSEHEIDKVRAAMLFPEGTKPKWYRTQAPNDVNAESSGDEEGGGVGNGSQPAPYKETRTLD